MKGSMPKILLAALALTVAGLSGCDMYFVGVNEKLSKLVTQEYLPALRETGITKVTVEWRKTTEFERPPNAHVTMNGETADFRVFTGYGGSRPFQATVITYPGGTGKVEVRVPDLNPDAESYQDVVKAVRAGLNEVTHWAYQARANQSSWK